MTLATGLAMGGERPVVALYSTFLQRAFDQVVHDVCQNDQPVADRGRPGRASSARTARATRACSRCRPSASCRTWSSPARRTSRSCARCSGRRSARTTRSRCTTPAMPASTCPPVEPRLIPVGQAEVLQDGSEVLLIGFGPIVDRGPAGRPSRLAAEGWSVGLINARFAKPLDRQLILEQARGKRLVVTLEESVVSRRLRQRRAGAARGGAGRRPGLPRGGPQDHRHPGRSVRRARFGGRPAAPDPARRRTGSPRRSARRSRPSTRSPARARFGKPRQLPMVSLRLRPVAATAPAGSRPRPRLRRGGAACALRDVCQILLLRLMVVREGIRDAALLLSGDSRTRKPAVGQPRRQVRSRIDHKTST